MNTPFSAEPDDFAVLEHARWQLYAVHDFLRANPVSHPNHQILLRIIAVTAAQFTYPTPPSKDQQADVLRTVKAALK